MGKTIKKSSIKQDKKTIKNVTNLVKLDREFKKEIFEISDKNELYKLLEKIENEHVKQNQIKNKVISTSIYPSIYDQNFAEKISNKKQFGLYKINKRDKEIDAIYSDIDIKPDTDNSKIFKLSNSQNFLRNYISPNTPYHNLLVIHGTGVGKTCTAITIAEQFKDIVYNNKKHITVLNGKDFNRQLFDKEQVHLKNMNNQCTRTEYIDKLKSIGPELVENCENKISECDILQNKVKKQIDKYYIFNNLQEWANRTDLEITKKGKQISDKDALKYKIDKIREKYSNTVLIIDEAHHLNDNDKIKVKKVSKILTDILLYSENLRLIMLTATPMFDKPSDIITLINYMLINDKRKQLNVSDIFDENNYILPGADKLLKDKTRGYITYLRSNNPIDFPIRLPSSINLKQSAFLNLQTYPNIPEQFSQLKHKMRLMEIIDCPLQGIQKTAYKSIEIGVSGVDWLNSLPQISNCVYQSVIDANKDISSVYAQQGLDAISTKKRGKITIQFKDDETGKHFLPPMLSKYACKISKILENIKKANGPVFIYTKNISSGVIPLVIALEMAGYRPYKAHGTPFIDNKYKSSEYMGDYIIKSGSQDKFSTNAKDVNKYISKGKSMINEKNVKIFIGTDAASEGISLFGYREVHILEPHFNLSKLEQVIGRTIRTGSHLHLPFMDRNVSIYYYAATLPEVETIDLYKYRMSENKAITSGLIERLLKENAVDCASNIEGNLFDKSVFPKKVKINTSHNITAEVMLNDKPYSRACDYLEKCEYKCGYQIDNSNSNENTINIKHIHPEVDRILLEIEKLVGMYYRLTIDDIADMVNQDNLEYVNIAVFKIMENNKQIKDKYGRKGYITKVENSLIFVPEWEQSKDIEYATQYIKPEETYRSINMKYYIDYISKNVDKIIAKPSFTYGEILYKFQYDVDLLKYTQMSLKFNITLTDQEIVDYIFTNYIYRIKLEILKSVILKKMEDKIPMTELEKKLLKSAKSNIIYYSDFDNSSNNNKIYGFIIANNQTITLYHNKNGVMVVDTGSIKKIIENKRRVLQKMNISNLYGYLKYDKSDTPPTFKIVDITSDTKKSIKGMTCESNTKQNTEKYLKTLGTNIGKLRTKEVICNDLEFTFIRLNEQKKNGKIWFLYPEDYMLYKTTDI